jgi:uncharacterized protein YkwD
MQARRSTSSGLSARAHIKEERYPMLRSTLVAAATAVFCSLLALPAGAASKNAGVLKDGVFTPDHPALAAYGADDSFKCPRGGPAGALSDEVEEAKGEGARPVLDGRLCAIGETILDLDPKAPVPLELLRFLANYFGLGSVPRVSLAITDTDRAKDLGRRLVGPVVDFSTDAVKPHYGIATLRISPRAAGRGEGAKASTKVALVFWDEQFQLDPLPRKLAKGQQAVLSGKLTDPAATPRIDIGSPDGKYETSTQTAGQPFKATLQCGDRAGDIRAELYSELSGMSKTVGTFTVSCGGEPATSVKLLDRAAIAFDAAAQEKAVLDAINADRTALGLAALEWDEGVAKTARGMAEAVRDDLQAATAIRNFDVIKLLKDNNVVSPLIVVNPAGALTAMEAYQVVAESPYGRNQYLNPSITHAGIGLALVTNKNGVTSVVQYQVFVKQQPAHDLAKVKEGLVAEILRKRADARADVVAVEATLEATAQKYAEELAGAQNNLPKERDEALLEPLRKKASSIKIVSGAPTELADFVEQPGVISQGKTFGLGIAEGFHPVLGKHTVYVVLIIAQPKAGKGGK